MNAPNPWEEHANAAIDADGEHRSGWLLKYANLPADIAEEHSETPYMTGRAIDFMDRAATRPALPPLLHQAALALYRARALPRHVWQGAHTPRVRTEEERRTDHPVFRAYIESRVCRTFSRQEVRERVIPAYMGLVKQIDDQMGRLFAWMEERGLMRAR